VSGLEKSDFEAIRLSVIQRLEEIAERLRSGQLRDRVRALIPVFLELRNLGSLQLPSEGKTREAARLRILRYLQYFPGTVIAGHELMVISGIGEYPRRIRELRVKDGWPIISGMAIGDIKSDPESAQDNTLKMKPDEYCLLEDKRDKEASERWKAANGIRKSKGGVKEKILKYLLLYVGKPINGEELRYIANRKKEWARRTRELRTEDGWPVATRFSGRPDLPMGVYVLEADEPAPANDRNISEKIRQQVLVRDHHTCQECEWNFDKAKPSDMRFLELHHVIHHVDKGENTSANLITLCNKCHDERHKKNRSR
jgi:hypothetical protein